jgi:hypothetical protein
VNIENLLSIDWREAQFYNTSRLKGEPINPILGARRGRRRFRLD